MITLISFLAAWGIVSSIPFEKGAVNTMEMCNDTLYVGGRPGKSVQRLIVNKSGKLEYLKESEPLNKTPRYIKDIEVYGDYVYAITRGNGYGLSVDVKRPDYISPFEGVIGFENTDTDGDIRTEFVSDPCPSRFCKSLHFVKPEGKSHCVYSHAVPATQNEAEFLLWLKAPNALKGSVSIPLVKDIMAVSIDSDRNLGLVVKGVDKKGNYACGEGWINLKVTAKSGKASLSWRGPECEEQWKEICSAEIGDFQYESVCCGLEGEGAADLFIDEYAYAVKDIETLSHINGSLVVLEKKTMKVVNRYKIDLRCLALHIDGNTMYLGMIGGINIYDLSNPARPTIKGVFREPDRLWSYPRKGEIKYTYKVPGQEYQRLDFMTLPDGKKILVGGNDVQGITMVDVTDGTAPKMYKHINTVPKVPIKESKRPQNKYIEWDVLCDYPYIYSTVASLHSLVHSQYYSGKDTPIDWTPDTYGVKVYDISNPDAIKDTVIRVTAPYYPNHIAKEGDSNPNQMTRIGDRLYMALGDKGVAVFKLNGFDTKFESVIKIPENNRVGQTCAYGNQLLVGGGAIFGPWTECNIFLINPKKGRK